MSGLTWLAWQGLQFFFVLLPGRRRVFRGKILTMPVRRRVRFFDLHPFPCRVIQTLVVCVPMTFLASNGTQTVVDTGWLAALYLDDYLTGDDDQWRRFKDRVKNAVRWKMALPQTEAS